MVNKILHRIIGIAVFILSLSSFACQGSIGTTADASANFESTCGQVNASPTPSMQQTPTAAQKEIQYPLRGVTADSVENLDELAASIQVMTAQPAVRIVFDPENAVSDYAQGIQKLGKHAYLMGELIDSDSMTLYTAEEVGKRAEDFISAYGDQIDIWEIGNEINGEWVGKDPEEINAKVQAAYDVVSTRHHHKTAITLNYWSGPACYNRSWEPTLKYAETVPEEIRKGVDYVFLSIYETACDPYQKPTAKQIGAMLVELGKLFPNASLGIGEIGAQNETDGFPAPTYSEKVRIARRYYGMHDELKEIVGARFVGGYFWWYYCEDALPKDGKGSIWPVLNELLARLK